MNKNLFTGIYEGVQFFIMVFILLVLVHGIEGLRWDAPLMFHVSHWIALSSLFLIAFVNSRIYESQGEKESK